MTPVLSADEIQAGVRRLAQRIAREYAGRPLTVVGVMTGSVIFLADLIRQLDMPLRVGFVQASSYRGGIERGELTFDMSGAPGLAGRDVLVADDIFDTGHTLAAITAHLAAQGPRSVRSAVLLAKRGCRQTEYRPDFVAFEIPDVFVVGYGLDYQDEYRNLPYVAALSPSDLSAGELAPGDRAPGTQREPGA